MTWMNPYGTITQYRTQLLLCDTIITSFATGVFHYPSFGPSGATPDTLPACLLQEGEQDRDRYAEGAIPLISGILKASFYFEEAQATDAGWLESFCRSVIYDLGKQFNGLPFKNHKVTLSSEPTPGLRAADGENLYRAATITSTYGLTR